MMTIADADYIRKLEDIAHAAWHALDDSGDDGDDITILRMDYELLSAALKELDGGGDIHDTLRQKPREVMTGRIGRGKTKMSRVPDQCHSCGRMKGPGHICPRACDKCGIEYAATCCPKCFPWLSSPDGRPMSYRDGLPPPIDRSG